jgi:carbon monoxide dehydrogenase subunit G
MEVKIDKQFPLEVAPAQAWAVLSDIRAVAPCMPGAQITEQTDDTHYKGTVKTRIGPASMQFNGTIEVLSLDAATRSLQMLGKGADRTGSAASMNLTARIVDGAHGGTSVLEGQAVVSVSGKLAQFGNRLLVPVADALLAEFAKNFGQAAAAVALVPAPQAGPGQATGAEPAVAPKDLAGSGVAAGTDAAAATAAPRPVMPRPAAASPTAAPAAAPAAELNVLSLLWSMVRQWWRGLFGGRR